MVTTRKRSYCEEVSQSSSILQIAYSDRSRPKQFDQQEGKRQKRQKKSKESRFSTFDMSNGNIESYPLVSRHRNIYVKLLVEVCSGQYRSMGNAKDERFWRNFADTFCKSSGIENKEGMHISCQNYCDNLKSEYNYMKKTHGLYPLDGPSTEYWSQLTRIFGGRTPSTSTGSLRSSRSRGSTSSIKSGCVKKTGLTQALAELAYSGDLGHHEIQGVEKYVSDCKTGMQIFVGGPKEYKMSVVREYRELVVHKRMRRNYQETEIEETQMEHHAASQ